MRKERQEREAKKGIQFRRVTLFNKSFAQDGEGEKVANIKMNGTRENRNI